MDKLDIQCHHRSLDTGDAVSALGTSSDGTLQMFRWSTFDTGSFAVNLKDEKDDKLTAKENDRHFRLLCVA